MMADDFFADLVTMKPKAGTPVPDGRATAKSPFDQDNVLPSEASRSTLTPGAEVSDLLGQEEEKEALVKSQSPPMGASTTFKVQNQVKDFELAVETTMRRFASGLHGVLEDINRRLEALENQTERLDRVLSDSREADTLRGAALKEHLGSLDAGVRDVARSVQLVRDKQELLQAQAELAKLAANKHGDGPSVPPPTPADSRQASVAPDALKITTQAPASALHLSSQPSTEVQPKDPPAGPPAVPQVLPTAPAAPQTPQAPVIPPTLAQPPAPAAPQPGPQQHSVAQQPAHSQQAPSAPQQFSAPPIPPREAQPQQPQHYSVPPAPHFQQSQPQYSAPLQPPPPPQAPQYNAPPPPQYSAPPPAKQFSAPPPSAYGTSNSYQYGGSGAPANAPAPHSYSGPPSHGGQSGYPSLVQPQPSLHQRFGGGGGPPPPPTSGSAYGGGMPFRAPPPRDRAGYGGGHQSGNRQQPPPSGPSSQSAPRSMPLEQVIDDVANMGFSRGEVRAVVSELMERGQAVDLNIVLDRLMNGGPPRTGSR